MFVTDAGLETDLLFRRGLELPHFAAFPLLDTDEGRRVLTDYFTDFATIAASSGHGLLLEAPTWRANPDWGTRLGYDAAALRRVNAAAIAFVRDLAARHLATPTRVGGTVGPRYDGYSADALHERAEAARYHRAQLAAFAEAGAELATAYTMTHVDEAMGIVDAARAVGIPIAISFTVEVDGRLPSGDTLASAIAQVDAATPPDYFLVNCAHPTHIASALDEPGDWRERIHGTRANASTKSHAELDEATELDDGDPQEFADAHALLEQLPNVTIVGGCCGTDSRHVAALVSRTR